MPGQRVSISFEALPKLVLTGRVMSIGQIPTRVTVRGDDVRQPMDTGIRFFNTVVKLDKVTDDLRPGMTTMVDFGCHDAKTSRRSRIKRSDPTVERRSVTWHTTKALNAAWSESARIRPIWSRSSMVCRKVKWSRSILREPLPMSNSS